ncbi:MAG: Bug family tripartite tricarboxylate transporter substrate binding protein [Burkholderiales bacterium]
MNTLLRRHANFSAAIALTIAAAGFGCANAQPFPNRPVKIVAPFPPGGAVDAVSRLLAIQLREPFGQNVLVENIIGATGQIGVEHVARAQPDGHTAVLAASAAIVINPHLAKLSYDSLKDLVAITNATTSPSALAVHASVPAKTLMEFIDYVKARPGKVSYAVSGIGSQLHLAGEILKQRTGIDMLAVPYKGTAPSTMAVVANEVPATISDLTTLRPHHLAGKIRILAVVDARRTAAAPDIPTVAEAGVPGFVASGWLGLFTTAGTPPEVVARWNKEVVSILRKPDIQKTLLGMGVEADPNPTPEAAATFVRSEHAKWGAAIKAGNIKLEEAAR